MDKELQPIKKAKVVEQLARTGILKHACDAAGCSRMAIANWRAKDPEFNQACIDAIETAIDIAEAIVQDRATQGHMRPVIYKGEMIYMRDPTTGEPLLDANFEAIPLMEPVDQADLLKFYVTANRDKYNNKKVELSGPGGGGIPHTVTVSFINPDGTPGKSADPLED